MARVAHVLGVDATVLVLVGGCVGAQLLDLLAAQDVATEAIPIAGDTCESLTVLEAATGRQYRFVMPGPAVTEEELAAAEARIEALARRSSAVVLSGPSRRTCSLGASDRWSGASGRPAARSSSTPPATSAGCRRLGGDAGHEAERAGAVHLRGEVLSGEPEIVAVAHDLLALGPNEAVVVSLGVAGALLVRPDTPAALGCTHHGVHALSTVGAGDSLVGAMAAALEHGAGLEAAVCRGVAAGTAVTLAHGTGRRRREDVERLLPHVSIHALAVPPEHAVRHPKAGASVPTVEGTSVAGPRSLRQLLDAVMAIGSDLDLAATLRRIIEAARSWSTPATARSACSTTSGPRSREFITVGIDDDDARRSIGDLPRAMASSASSSPTPGRCACRICSEHPDSFGFPPGHPPMRSFLGVPIRSGARSSATSTSPTSSRPEVFTDVDEELMVALAAAAGVAIENARLHAGLQELVLLEDRERIAMDLHDTVIQQLFATGCRCRPRPAASSDEEAAQRLQLAVDDLDVTIKRIRSTIFELGAPAHRAWASGTGSSPSSPSSAVPSASTRMAFNGPMDSVVTTRELASW